MGLFDSLKKGLSDLQKEVDAHKDEINKFAAAIGADSKNRQQSAASPSPAPAPAPAPAQDIDPYEGEFGSGFRSSGPVTDRTAYFADVIARNFPDLEVRQNYPAREMDPLCHPKCAPVTFMFFKNGAPVLAVALVRTNNYRGMNVKATQQICFDRGIRYIRFYHEFKNEETYVVNRIRENL